MRTNDDIAMVDDLMTSLVEVVQRYESDGGNPFGIVSACGFIIETVIHSAPEAQQMRMREIIHNKLCLGDVSYGSRMLADLGRMQ